MAEIVVNDGEVGLEGDCALQARGGVRQASLTQVADAEIIVRSGIIGREPGCFKPDSYRFGKTEVATQQCRELVARIHRSPVEQDNVPKELDGHRGPPGPGGNHREHLQRRRIAGLEGEDVGAERFRIAQAARLERERGFQQKRIARFGRHRLCPGPSVPSLHRAARFGSVAALA